MDTDPLSFAELLCARLCHDLAGPVGAAAAGAELFDDLDGPVDGETIGLVAASAHGAAARLKFFRAALGPAASAPQSAAFVRDLAEGYLKTQVSAASPGTELAWHTAQPFFDGEWARLLLHMVLLAKDALPRGGRIVVEFEAGMARIEAHGEPAAWGEEVFAVLNEGRDPNGPKGAQAHFARLSARNAHKKLAIGTIPGAVLLLIEDEIKPVDGGSSRVDG